MTAIYTLAREIGAPFDATHENTQVLGHYIAELLSALETDMRWSLPFDANPQALPLISLANIAIRSAAGGDEETLAMIGGNIDEITDTVDNDDGWPTCPWLLALKHCGLALKIAIEERTRYNTRWPAEAGLTVAARLGKTDAKEWLVERLNWAVAHSEGRVI